MRVSKKLEIYKCNVCDNIVEVLTVGEELVCCGQSMELLKEKTENIGKEKHAPVIEKTKNGIKVKIGSVSHPMEEKHFIIAMLSLIVLAFAINLVKLICSARLPVIYTKIFALSNLAIWQYYGYLALYIFIFMLDDLIVFFVAIATLQLPCISTKYSRLSYLISGIVILIIGILMLFKPKLLMFG